MPYTIEHKRQTRARIVEAARVLFNRRGFTEVPIDEIMASAGLTRGGFYNHFDSKEELYAEAIDAYAVRREADNASLSDFGPDMARRMVERYVSRDHRVNVDGHCPLMALPSDVARSGGTARAAYRRVLEALVRCFELNLEPRNGLSARERAMALSATCVGAMVLARTIDDHDLADEICVAARTLACDEIGARENISAA